MNQNTGLNLKLAGSVLAICGTLGTGVNYLGGRIYDFAKQQTLIIEHVKGAEQSIGRVQIDLATQIANQDGARDKAIAALNSVLLPKIEKLEDKTSDAAEKAAAAEARMNAFKEGLDRLQLLAEQNLAVSNSHTQDIRATKKAVTGNGIP